MSMSPQMSFEISTGFFGVPNKPKKYAFFALMFFGIKKFNTSEKPRDEKRSHGVDVFLLFAPDFSNKLEMTILVGGFEPTHLKIMRKSNWIIFPKNRGENSKEYVKPPTSKAIQGCRFGPESKQYSGFTNI